MNEGKAWLSTITGLDYWTGLLDWTTGLDYSIAIQCIMHAPSNAEPMLSQCPAYAQPKPSLCSATVQPMLSQCPAYAQPMSSLCSANVQPMLSHSPAYAQPQSSLCSANVQPIYYVPGFHTGFFEKGGKTI